jgi:predicted DCC family thiol-disulfide oxidoreductase YuxK
VAELTVLYDERCGFCTTVARRLAASPAIVAAPIGSDAGTVLLRDLAPAERAATVHVIDERGRRLSGGAALTPVLRRLPHGRVPARLLEALPAATEAGYRLVARNRGTVARLARMLGVDGTDV